MYLTKRSKGRYVRRTTSTESAHCFLRSILPSKNQETGYSRSTSRKCQETWPPCYWSYFARLVATSTLNCAPHRTAVIENRLSLNLKMLWNQKSRVHTTLGRQRKSK